MAAALHVTVALLLFLAGRLALVSSFDTNGILVPSDSTTYRVEAAFLAETFARSGIAGWMAAPSPLHVKLYSLSFVIFGPVCGFTILGAEPLNLVYYLSTLTLIFLLGREVFDRTTGLIAAAIVALWPSPLVFSTQLYRDPLFVALLLAIVLITVRWLTQVYEWPQALMTGAAGGALATVMWVVRKDVWEIVLIILCVGLLLLLVRQFREKRVLGGNLLGALLLLTIMAGIPRFVAPFQQAKFVPVAATWGPPDGAVALNPTRNGTTSWSHLLHRIKGKRRAWQIYSTSGSNIDSWVQFNSVGDIILYLPRAVAIGFFAPFPNMWLEAGTGVGRAGRLLSGAETCLMYTVQLLALFCLWRERRQLSVWLLAVTICLGVTALGIVVCNVGALYRLRYIYWMLLIIVGAGGALRLPGVRPFLMRVGRATNPLREGVASDCQGERRVSS